MSKYSHDHSHTKPDQEAGQPEKKDLHGYISAIMIWKEFGTDMGLPKGCLNEKLDLVKA